MTEKRKKLVGGGYNSPSLKELRVNSRGFFCTSITGQNREKFGTFVVVDEDEWDTK